MKSTKNIKPWEDASKSDDQVHLADMHGDGVHFDKQVLAKAKRKKQLDEENFKKKARKKNRK